MTVIGNELVLTRVLAAPRSLVWKAWTDAGHLAKWWGPPGSQLQVKRLDVRVAGEFRFGMVSPDTGGVMWARFLFDEVEPQVRLAFRLGITDEKGVLIPFPGLSSFPLETRHLVSFEDQGPHTLVTLRVMPHLADDLQTKAFAELLSDMSRGYGESLDQLESVLAHEAEAERSLVYKRTFDAPRATVWKAWTDPTSIAAWWGPSGFGNTIRAMDVRVGGVWEYTMHGPDGVDYPNLVTYVEVDQPSRLVYDHGSPDQPNQFRVTVSFSDKGGQTDMVCTMVFPTVQAKKDVVEQYGAVEGLKQNMDRFAHWLTKSGLVLTRVLPAPRARVWKAFTDPKILQQWWGPEGFTCPGAHVDLHIGGKYLLGMKGSDGVEIWGTGLYREIILNQKLVYTDNFADAQGNIVPATALGLPGDWPEEQLVALTFAELGKDKTLLTVHQAQLPDNWKAMTVAGWSTSFDKLTSVLK